VGEDEEVVPRVEVRLVVAPKGQFVKLVSDLPLPPHLFPRSLLEENLRKHATLTEGDKLEIWSRGQRVEVEVEELRYWC